MSDERSPIRFENPPVVETLFGIQFRPLAGFTSAHFGWFWQSVLGREWGHPAEAPLLPERQERFDRGPAWETSAVTLKVVDRPGPERMLFTHTDGSRRLQLQPGLLVLNWRLQAEPSEPGGETATSFRYVHFEERLSQFRTAMAGLSRFCEGAGLPEMIPNQWEVTYINHISRGTLWEHPRDWPHLLPSLFPEWSGFDGAALEAMGGRWQLELKDRRGRLYVNAGLERRVSGEAREDVLALTLTARGPVPVDAPAEGSRVEAGLTVGHDAVVRGFAAITSETARRTWGQI